MLLNYMRHYLGIRNTDVYIELYSDMRDAYELTDNLNSSDAVKSICSNLHTKTSAKEQSLLLLRLMEFCGGRSDISIFRTLAEVFHIPEERFNDYRDYVDNRVTERVMIHQLENTDGQLKTLLDPHTGMLLFTYMGSGEVLLNDVKVFPGTFYMWLQSSVVKAKNGTPLYYSTIIRGLPES